VDIPSLIALQILSLSVKFRWTIVLLLLQRSLFPLSNSFSLGFLNLEYYVSNLPDLYLYSLIHIHSLSLLPSSYNQSFKSSITLWIQSQTLGRSLWNLSSLHHITHIHLCFSSKFTYSISDCKLFTLPTLHSITELKECSSNYGTWPILHFLRLSATSLDYSP
jgi:hypothetical protein